MTQQRTSARANVIAWLKACPNMTLTLTEGEIFTGNHRNTIASAMNAFLRNETMPGLERLGKGVYRYTPPSPSPSSNTSNSTVTLKSTPVEAHRPMNNFIYVGSIDTNAVVLKDFEGALWRAERLR